MVVPPMKIPDLIKKSDLLIKGRFLFIDVLVFISNNLFFLKIDNNRSKAISGTAINLPSVKVIGINVSHAVT